MKSQQVRKVPMLVFVPVEILAQESEEVAEANVDLVEVVTDTLALV